MPAVAVIGGGPAGLMAAEMLATCDCTVTVIDHMRSPGRKFLVAGRGGLNLTHSEPLDDLLARYTPPDLRLLRAIAAFPPSALRAWCESLGEETFVGSSGRVFPRSMRATPLLRAWLRRLDELHVRFLTRHRFEGWDVDGRLRVTTPDVTDDNGGGEVGAVDAVVLALGGASWPGTGSDGGWRAALRERGIAIEPLEPANSGFLTSWTPSFAERFVGFPLKNVSVAFDGRSVRGELMVTETGLEGGPMYAHSYRLRTATRSGSVAHVTIDLRADLSLERLAAKLKRSRGSQSMSTFLRKSAGLKPVAIALLRETSPNGLPIDPEVLAARIKAAPLDLLGPSPIARAISTAGGVAWEEIDDDFMLRRLPGVFVCGEMLDWEAQTGGYLLQASFSTAVAAAEGVLRLLAAR